MKSKDALPNKQKSGLVIVYTGEGKGKTSAGIGLITRSLGVGWKVAFIQFIKSWQVSEDSFFESIASVYEDKLVCYKGGQGFYNVGEFSAQNVSEKDHKKAAQETYDFALRCATSGEYDLVVCDEINNSAHDELIGQEDFRRLIIEKHPDTTICLTGRNFPKKFEKYADIITNMTKIKHHYDDGFIANRGIDY